MKIMSSQSIQISLGENSIISYKDIENNLELVPMDSNVVFLEKNTLSLNTRANGFEIENIDGKVISFRQTPQGIIFVTTLTRLVDFKEEDYIKIQLGDEK